MIECATPYKNIDEMVTANSFVFHLSAIKIVNVRHRSWSGNTNDIHKYT